MNRRNTMLAALLAVQVVLILILYWPGEAERTSEIKILDVDPSSITSLTISDGYGSSLVLEHRGRKWFIDPPEDYKADAKRVRTALKKIAHLSSTRLVSSARGSHARLSVSADKFNRRLQVVDSNGEKHVIYLGTAMGRGVHARNEDSPDVVFLPGLSFWEFATTPRSWWKSSLVDLDQSALKDVELSNSHGTMHLERNQDGNWTDESGTALDQAGVRQFLDGIKNIRVLDYISSDTDKKLETPIAVIRLVSAKGDEIILQVGPAMEKTDKTDKMDNSDHLIKISTDKHLAKISNTDAGRITSMTRSSLSSSGNQVVMQSGSSH